MNGMLDHLCLQGVKMALFTHDAVFSHLFLCCFDWYESNWSHLSMVCCLNSIFPIFKCAHINSEFISAYGIWQCFIQHFLNILFSSATAVEKNPVYMVKNILTDPHKFFLSENMQIRWTVEPELPLGMNFMTTYWHHEYLYLPDGRLATALKCCFQLYH